MKNYFGLVAGTVLAVLACPATAAKLSKAESDFFESKIRPVLIENCYKCHSADKKVKGELLVDSKQGLLTGGESGPAIVPGNPSKSLLMTAISYKDSDLEMPPAEKLPAKVIADFDKWIKMGAPDPREIKGKLVKAGAEVRNHWAFQDVRKPAVPKVSDRSWVKNPLDAFILAKLEGKGMKPNTRAEDRTLIRRLYMDLIGFPPEPRHLDYFLADKSAGAIGKVIDSLLASDHFGERWARHWLDTARYADTRGNTNRRNDPAYAFAWTYRDYVIRALNQDKPYDQFIIEQLAADKIKLRNPNDLAALGFLTLGDRFMDVRDDIIDDRIDVVSKGFLGLTVACSRCHDHKFDPIPTADYYSMYSIFANSAEPKDDDMPLIHQPEGLYANDYAEKIKPHEKTIEDMEKILKNRKQFAKMFPNLKGTALNRKRRDFENQRNRARQAISAMNLTHPGAPIKVHGLTDIPKPRDYPILVKGDPKSKGDIVPRRFLEILSDGKRTTYSNGSGRLELARDIASKDNKLTARVMVNKVWMHLFGDGIIPTPDDLGVQSEPPDQRELIDWLSVYFMENNWSVKKLIKLIVSSNAYQQSSEYDPRDHVKDPRNRLYWRQNIRRIEFEPLRDTILAIGKKLDTTLYGRPVNLSSFRRTIYGYVDRRSLEETLFAFDFADPNFTNSKRGETTVPLQALFMMNSPLVIEQSRSLVNETQFRNMSDAKDRLNYLYERIYGRPPASEEIRLGVRFYMENRDGDAAAVKEQIEQMQKDRYASIAMSKQAAKQKNVDGRKVFQQLNQGLTKGPFKDKPALTSWEKIAHSLFMANEMFYVQ